jgi:hypothetical protein
MLWGYICLRLCIILVLMIIIISIFFRWRARPRRLKLCLHTLVTCGVFFLIFFLTLIQIQSQLCRLKYRHHYIDLMGSFLNWSAPFAHELQRLFFFVLFVQKFWWKKFSLCIEFIPFNLNWLLLDKLQWFEFDWSKILRLSGGSWLSPGDRLTLWFVDLMRDIRGWVYMGR